jgi:Zn-dependent protease
MSTFYDIDSTRVSFKEYWWGTKSPAVLIGWLVKLLRTRIPSSSDDPNTESTLPFVVPQLPVETESAFAPLASELSALGFIDPVFHQIHDPGTRTTVYWATYRHESGNYFARIHQRIWLQTVKQNRGLFLMFFTEFTDGTFLVSSSGKPDMDAPATIEMNRMQGATSSALWEKHVALAAERANGKVVVPVTSQEDVIAATERHHVLTRDFHLARGVFRARKAEEQAQAESYAAAVEQGRAIGVKHPEILAELEKLQESKPAWGNTIWMLVGSIVLFFIIGAANWSWKIALWLIPALFIHEGGHWLTMRIFKYRNLRMFFIPLFGAAVIGKNWNVAGWKKALVSLAGPLPGIALGFIIGIAGVITHRETLLEAAIILVFLNGFNLLPILPLDGGHFMQAILFCRNRWLDTSFRVLAIAGMIGLSAVGMGRALMYIGIAMAVSLPVTFKLGKVSDTMRRASLPPPLPGQDRIPTATAEMIVSGIKEALPKNLSNKIAAQHSLTVFENLNARPPGIPATIGLLALYGGGVFLAIVSGLFFLVAKQGKLSDLVNAAARQPSYAFTCGNFQTWHGAEALSDRAAQHNVLVTTLANVPAAKSAFTTLTSQLPANSQLTRFGQSLLVTLPCSDDAGREKWFDRLQEMNTNAFVAVSNQPVSFNLNFIAPTETDATNLERVLRNYFNGNPGVRLIPPWSPEAQQPGFAAFDREREMWRRIGKELSGAWTNAELATLDNKIAVARKRGSVTEANNLLKERIDAYKNVQTAAVEKLKSNPDFDAQLIDLHTQLSEASYTNHAERAKILASVGEKLGVEKVDGGSSEPGSSFYSGFIVRNGLLFQLNWVNMDDPAAGLPAMTDWLCERHCIGIRYEFMGSFGAETEDAEDE